MRRNILSKGQFCADYRKDVVSIRTVKRKKINVPRRPHLADGRVQLIVTSSKHNQLGPKQPVLNTCENKLEMLEVLRCSEIALILFNTEKCKAQILQHS